MRRAGILLVGLLLVFAPAAQAQEIAAEFSDSYTLSSLGAPPGVAAPFGGLTLKAGTTDRLLIGGGANAASGALYEIGLVRDGDGHITGFSGEAERFADAANNDGGVAYGPGDVLFLARYPLGELGQTKPDSGVTDKIIPLAPLGVVGSLGALTFVPAGLPGAGSLKLATYTHDQWYDAGVVPDGTGTYDLVGVTPVEGALVIGGPEGIAYVNPGSPEFGGPSVLISEYRANRVSAYEVDADGNPLVATRRDFVTALAGAEGAFVDPVTGDFLFSTYGASNRVLVVRGFAQAATLSVVTNVVNDDLGTLRPEDFTVHVRRDGVDVDGSPQPGSEAGTVYTLAAGVEHAVGVDDVPGYVISMSGDCQSVIPEEGVQKTCTITADDAEPATLSVTTQVDGGAWLPEDFTVHLTSGGVELPGSPQPGSDKGTAFTVPPGRYVLSQDAARGYAAKIGGACAADGAVTLEPGASVSCTIVNGVVPVGDGLVVESYAPARTDGDWGLTEPYLMLTRGYLENPANFGPNGIVTRLLRVTPGIRVANPRTLDGVDVLFTGWVPTFSYTDAERDALRAFVLGGGTLIATTDDTGHTIVDLFGLTQGDGGGNPTPNTITNPGHPIANGAFGAVTTFNQYAATGHYPTLGPDAVEVGRNAQGTSLAVIERGKLGPGSGAAIFVADVDVFSDHGGASENATLIKNLFAFAAGEGPLPSLAVSDAAGAEGNAGGRAFTFTVTLSAPSSRAVRVNYATADGTASAPSDYAAAAGTVEFAPGETSKPVSVTVNGDTTVEADERFSLNLSSPSAARIADAQGIGTIFNDDVTVVPLPPQLPAPVPGERLNVVPKSGTVTIKLRGTSRFVALQAGQQVPVGSVIDTTKGRVTLVAASDRSGGTATADFYAGIFEVGQAKSARPITTLELVERLSCGRARASAAARRKKKRRLWGDGSGRFRTEGSYSSATVRGTRWLVEDRCTNSLTRVAVGRVTVRDFAKRKTVIVRAGNQYVARRRANG